MIFFFALPIFLGILCAYLWPYYALAMGSFTIYILAAMSLITFSQMEFSFKRFNRIQASEILYVLFAGFFILPSIIWLLSIFIFDNVLIRIGFFWAAFSPIALFVPGLISSNKKSENYKQSVYLLMFSIAFFALSLITINQLFFKNVLDIPIKTYILDISISIVIPILIIFLIKKHQFLSKVVTTLKINHINLLNFWIVGLLTYIFLGTSFLKLNVAIISNFELTKIFVFSILFDFILYALIKIISIGIVSEEFKKEYQASLSLRNVALSGGILLFYSPQSVLPIAGIFISHGLFVNFLKWIAGDRKIKLL